MRLPPSSTLFPYTTLFRSSALRRVLVVSALCGLLAGTDPVPDHRLKLSVSLDGIGRLDRWWRPTITDALRAHARRHTVDRKSTRLNSSHGYISYAVFCLKK